MSSTFLLPSHFGSSFITTIPVTRYDSKGRQMSFPESEVQRLERQAFINASRSRSSSPSLSPPGSPTRAKLISEPYGDPIELMANRLAEEFMYGSSDSSEDEQTLFFSPKRAQRVPPPARAPAAHVKSSTSFTPGHKKKRSSLSAIPEED
ncbi:hypothetical protein D9619_011806 [Psilocybe cf. subviscida]|uniref:Uncharacterized protein n=1 Tax=Psilocybe cf. subviscida TaxID=2480587 RepID=A0A8H5B1E8_9AGAR|nr:hypothetical protein D9619_011806 [Psilocybe cf. subviscida]